MTNAPPPASDPFRDHVAAALAPAYTLEREITGGGMSRVFVAQELALGRRVVVKVLPPDLAAGVNRERFRREIQLAAQLQHPHIVPLLSAGEQGDLLWYTMPYVEGESLKGLLRARGRLSVRETMRVLHDVVDALAYAHGRGVVHRDIKPANILTHGSHALVADFGVAKALSAAMPHSGTTSTGIAIGTPAYMAPEQLAADPAADHRVDLYAVGLLAYELLTGDQPFTGPSPQATMAAQLTRMPTPLTECCPDVPADLSAVIMQCLAKSPDERPASAEALLERLDGLATPAGAHATGAASGFFGGAWRAGPATPKSGGTPATTLAPPRRRWLVGAGLAAAVIALGLWALQLTGVRVTDRPAAPAESSGAVASASPSAAAAKASAPATPAPAVAAVPVLTREDSVRIAEAVQRRVEAAASRDSRTPGPDRDSDSLRQVLSRRMQDSVVREAMKQASTEIARMNERLRAGGVEFRALDSLSGRSFQVMPVPGVGASPRVAIPPMPPTAFTVARAAPGTRRVLLLDLDNATTQESLAPLVRAVNDSLRRALSAAGYDVLPADQSRELAGMADAGDRRGALAALGVGAVVSGVVVMRSGGALRAQVIVQDLARGNARSVRDGDDADDPREMFGVAEKTLSALGSVSWRHEARARRVVVFPLSDRSEHRAPGAAMAEVLTDSLHALVRRLGLEPVGDPALLAATTGLGDRRRLGEQLGAGAIIAGSINDRAGTRAVRIEVRDMVAAETRAGREIVVTDIRRTASLLAAETTGLLARIPWAPRGGAGASAGAVRAPAPQVPPAPAPRP